MFALIGSRNGKSRPVPVGLFPGIWFPGHVAVLFQMVLLVKGIVGIRDQHIIHPDIGIGIDFIGNQTGEHRTGTGHGEPVIFRGIIDG